MSILIAVTVWILSQLHAPWAAQFENFFASVFTQPIAIQSEKHTPQEFQTKTPKRVPVKRKESYTGKIETARKIMESDGDYALASMELLEAIKSKPDVITPYLELGELYFRSGENEKLENLIAQLKNKFSGDLRISVLEIRNLLAKKNFTQVMQLFSKNGSAHLPTDEQFYHAVLLSLQNNHKQALQILEKLNAMEVEKASSEKILSDTIPIKDGAFLKNKISEKTAKKVTDLLLAYQSFDVTQEGKVPYKLVLLGKSLSQNGEFVLAEEFSNRAIKEDPTYSDAWISRGYIHYLRKNYLLAQSDFQKAVELAPERNEANYFMGLILSEQNQIEQAIPFLEKAGNGSFEFSEEVKWMLADLYGRTGKYENAGILYTELITPKATPKKISTAMHILIDIAKKPELALPLAEKLYMASPDNVFLLNMYGWALTANKKFSEAEKILLKAKDIDPGNTQTFLNLGVLRETEGRISAAREFYRKSYEIGSTDPSGNPEIINLAVSRYNALLGKENKTEQPLSIEKTPNSP